MKEGRGEAFVRLQNGIIDGRIDELLSELNGLERAEIRMIE